MKTLYITPPIFSPTNFIASKIIICFSKLYSEELEQDLHAIGKTNDEILDECGEILKQNFIYAFKNKDFVELNSEQFLKLQEILNENNNKKDSI